MGALLKGTSLRRLTVRCKIFIEPNGGGGNEPQAFKAQEGSSRTYINTVISAPSHHIISIGSMIKSRPAPIIISLSVASQSWVTFPVIPDTVETDMSITRYYPL